MIIEDKEFVENTVYKETKYGVEIWCKKGLWLVCAPTEEQAIIEAMHYFNQYYNDGEYDD
jgi:hypothetical protein